MNAVSPTDGKTAVMSAAIEGYHDVLSVLLDDERTDAGVKDESGLTALDMVANDGDCDYSIISQLVRAQMRDAE